VTHLVFKGLILKKLQMGVNVVSKKQDKRAQMKASRLKCNTKDLWFKYITFVIVTYSTNCSNLRLVSDHSGRMVTAYVTKWISC